MNIRTRPIDYEEIKSIFELLCSGFVYEGHKIKSKKRIAVAILCEANLGIRISDVLRLTLNSFIKDNGDYYIDIIEKKTGKKRHLKINPEFIAFLQDYAIEFGLNKEQRLFPFTDRYIQKYLHMVCNILGYHNVSTHSLRKYYGTTQYNENGKDIRLVQILLNHSDIRTTEKYIGISDEVITEASVNHVALV